MSTTYTFSFSKKQWRQKKAGNKDFYMSAPGYYFYDLCYHHHIILPCTFLMGIVLFENFGVSHDRKKNYSIETGIKVGSNMSCYCLDGLWLEGWLVNEHDKRWYGIVPEFFSSR